MTNSSGRRLLARGFALWGGAVTLWFAGAGIRQLPTESATLGEQIFTSLLGGVLLVIVPLILSGLLTWWAWRGWRLDPQPRWMNAVRGGFTLAVIWAVVGTLGAAAWSTLVRGEDPGNVVGLIPALTSPIGFILGAIAGWFRPRTTAPRAAYPQ